MKKYFYDLHIHSCLSPCGDNNSTPDSIAGMGELNGLGMMALCDHNTCKNCPAFFEAAERHNVLPVAGMELTTAEEIHLVFLFPDLDSAMQFDSEISKKRIFIRNREEVFGEQLICDSEDRIIGKEEHLLSNATAVSLEEAPVLAEKFGGICFPAHIDREANGIIAVLGSMPVSPDFSCVEIHDREKAAELTEKFGLSGKKILFDSDAHYLWDIKEATDFVLLDEIPQGSRYAGKYLIKYLREGL